MRNLYEITNRNGKHLCYQVSDNEENAVDTARMYGFRGAAKAVFVREH